MTQTTVSHRLDAAIYKLVAAVTLSTIAVQLGSTMVNVAFNALLKDFHQPLTTIQWVATGYLLAMTTMIPLTGWAVGRFGAKRVWMVCLVGFLVGSVLCGLSWSMGSLIVFRVVQGLGGGMLIPLTRRRRLARAGRRGGAPDRLRRARPAHAHPAIDREPADVERTMARIEQKSDRLARLVEDLLLLDARPALHPEPMDLRSLAADARQELGALDPTRPVTLTGPGGDGPPGPAPVVADEARLRPVVTNLVGNAATHTPSGTPVRIGVGTRFGESVLEVADEGPGMTAEQAARVFARFYRADESRHRDGVAGAGLGLSIAESIVKAQGGRIELVTAPDRGATFRIVFPAFHQ